MDIINKSLNLIDDIINNTNAQNLSFYENVLKMVSSLYDDVFSISIFFSENMGFRLKAAIKNGAYIKKYNLNSAF